MCSLNNYSIHDMHAIFKKLSFLLLTEQDSARNWINLLKCVFFGQLLILKIIRFFFLLKAQFQKYWRIINEGWSKRQSVLPSKIFRGSLPFGNLQTPLRIWLKFQILFAEKEHAHICIILETITESSRTTKDPLWICSGSNWICILGSLRDICKMHSINF